MSIYKGNKKVIALYKGATPIKSVYKNNNKVYNNEIVNNDSLMILRTNSNDSFNVKINNMDYTLTPTNYEVRTDFATLGIEDFTNAYYMFNNCNTLTTVESLPSTTNVTNMYGMFGKCSGLTELDLSSFNTSNVTDMSYMFNACSKLTLLNLSSFDTSKVTNSRNMFYMCTGLTELDLSSFNTSNVTDMSYMFYACRNLTSLNLNNFNTSNVIDMSNMFYMCNGLTDLIWNNLGNGSGYTAISLSSSSKLGANSSTCPNARQHLIDTFVTNSFDRASNGYSTCTITLSSNTKAKLTNDEIAQMTAKGYTIA